MTSATCRAVLCPFFYKANGKAACKAIYPKAFLKHLDKCPQTL